MQRQIAMVGLQYLPIDGGEIRGSIIPDADGVYDIGDATHEFRYIYGEYIFVDTAVRLDSGGNVAWVNRARLYSNALDSVQVRNNDNTANGNLQADTFETGPTATYNGMSTEYLFEAQTTAIANVVAGSIAVGEDEAFLIEAHAIGLKSDGSNGWAIITQNSFYRDTGGNVTAAATANKIALDGGASTDCDLTVNVGTQSVDVEVGGIALTDINWTIFVRATKVAP